MTKQRAGAGVNGLFFEIALKKFTRFSSNFKNRTERLEALFCLAFFCLLFFGNEKKVKEE
jgi:hypothetical protein